jgi:hypothetical protein
MIISRVQVALLAAILLISGPAPLDLLAEPEPAAHQVAGGIGEDGPRTAGDDCDSPYDVVFDVNSFPFYLGGETTCGRANDYQNTCLGNFDGGEDFILRFDLQVMISLEFILHPNGTQYTGMLLSDHCPPDSDCIEMDSEYYSGDLTFAVPLLEPGIYYLMIDTWPSPDCIPSFDFEVWEVFFDNPGYECGFPLDVDISPGQSPVLMDYLYTCGAGDEYNSTCLGNYDDGEDFVLRLIVDQTSTYDIVLDPQGTPYTGMALADVCPPGHAECIATSTSASGSPHQINNVTLEPGEYYLMVDTWPQPDCIPQFTILIDGAFNHAMGDNCDLPQYLTLPDDLPITLSHQYSWGRGDDYNNTCLGDFDEGEDYVMQIDVSSAVCLNITLDPHGTAGTAFALSSECPPGLECIASSTNPSSSAHGVTEVSLDAGTYYLLVDCTASTGGIDDFDLTFEPCPSQPENDHWMNPIGIENVVNMPFSTTDATFDGPGVCQEAPNIWYCYTPPSSGMAEFSLCGSLYDTKLAVFRACDLDSVQVLLACNDDYCGLQSLAYVPVSVGHSYLIEVGGSAGATGEGVLTAYIPGYTCGDIDANTLVNISDVVYLIAWIFGGGPPPEPMVAADVDCNEIVNIADAAYLIMRIFGGGPEPCAFCK